jgi:hypothetical protein
MKPITYIVIIFCLKQIDYVRFQNEKEISEVNHILSNHAIPEAFKDKYFSRKEMENLLELKDIIE